MSTKLTTLLFFPVLLRALAQTVITAAGGDTTGVTSGNINGVGTSALFTAPRGVSMDTSGNVIVTDSSNNKIRLIYPNRTVITLAGGSTTGIAAGSTNGVGTASLLNQPRGVAVDASGNVIVADFSNHKIRLIYPNRTVITLAGGGSLGITSGYNDGVGTAAHFFSPSGIAVDTSGNVLVADYDNHKIRLIYPNRTVITLVGGSSSGITSGSTNGVGTSGLFKLPSGINVDTSGNAIVADTYNHKIRLIYPNRTVITLAGGSTTGIAAGSTNGVGTAALFNTPVGVAVDTSGNVIVADYGNHKIRLIYPNRVVITLSGGSTTGILAGSNNGVGTVALFFSPSGVAVDTSGNVIVADTGNSKVRLLYPFTCSPGTYANFTSRSCTLCPPGSFSAAEMAPSCSPCAAGTFAQPFGSTSCEACPGGHYCPAGTSSWARLNCGRGNYCPDGSSVPIFCPNQVPPSGGWGALQVQGPAFLVETAHCLSHCFWNFTSGDGMLSKC